MDEQENKRLAAIEAVRQAWNSLAKVASEHPGELVDVAHVLVMDGEGDRVDAAVAIVRKGHIERAATQGLGEGFENACDMLAQILLLRSSLLRATELGSPETTVSPETANIRLPQPAQESEDEEADGDETEQSTASPDDAENDEDDEVTEDEARE